MDRIKKLSVEILQDYKDKFGLNFDDNKKTLETISIVRSKSLKNEIAGFITRFLKHEMLDKQKQEDKLAKQAKLGGETQEENLDLEDSTLKTSQTEIQSSDEKLEPTSK